MIYLSQNEGSYNESAKHAHIVPLSEIGSYKGENVNVTGIIVATDNVNRIVVDDSSGQAVIRVMGADISGIEAGSPIRVIGRVTEIAGDSYISARIVKKIDAAWLEVQKTWFRQGEVAKKEEEAEKDEPADVSQYIADIIRSHDKGAGVEIDFVVEKANIEKCEDIIRNLILTGEVFEISPGKVKVLE